LVKADQAIGAGCGHSCAIRRQSGAGD